MSHFLDEEISESLFVGACGETWRLYWIYSQLLASGVRSTHHTKCWHYILNISKDASRQLQILISTLGPNVVLLLIIKSVRKKLHWPESSSQPFNNFVVCIVQNSCHTSLLSLVMEAFREAIRNGPSLLPPTGTESNFDNPSNRTGIAVGLATFFLVVSTVSVIFWLYARIFVTHKVQVDDGKVMKNLIYSTV